MAKGKGSRPGRSELLKPHMEPGDNTRYINHSLELAKLKKPDMTNPDAVNNRIAEYFEICAKNDMKPNVAGLALAFDVDRKTIWAWANGVDCKFLPSESSNAIKKAYQLLNVQMEDMMQNGRINPVAGIFLMKNNMGYKDEQEVTVKPNPMGDPKQPDELKQRYLEDIVEAEPIEE